jgi:LemA protein
VILLNAASEKKLIQRDHTVTEILLAGTAIVIWATILYNRLVRDRQRVLTAWSDIDVQLKRRYDLIPKLVAAVEQYARYEQSTLTTLIELRSRTGQVSDVGEKGILEGQIGGGLRSLIALAEAYPELKADRSFLQLQSELTEVENHIQYARRFYNGSVRNLNTRIESFPDLLIARLFHYARQPFFELDDTLEKASPEIMS